MAEKMEKNGKKWEKMGKVGVSGYNFLGGYWTLRW